MCSRYRLRPRVLRDVSCVSMETRLLGEQVDFPVGVSPTAFQCMAHPDGEQATARGEIRSSVSVCVCVCVCVCEGREGKREGKKEEGEGEKGAQACGHTSQILVNET